MSNCPIMQRMKENYERPSTHYLTRRTPVIMRLDGKSFHTYTKYMEKPFDDTLIHAMQDTAKFVCENIPGSKFAYTQSDEISILITDYDSIGTQAWFSYNISKMVSVASGFAAFKFNRLMYEKVWNPAFFDCRVFNIPEHDVNNYFVARQKDCTKNSISQVANTHFSAKQLHNASSDQRIKMLSDKGINWYELPEHYKYGTAIHRVSQTKVLNGCTIERRPFDIVPTFIFKESKDYVINLIINDE